MTGSDERDRAECDEGEAVNAGRAALLRRAAETMRDEATALRREARMACFGGPMHDAMADAATQALKDADALDALAAEPEATPPTAPWLDAPDRPGLWLAAPPGFAACTLLVTQTMDVFLHGLPDACPVREFVEAHTNWRYQLCAPVVVPYRTKKET